MENFKNEKKNIKIKDFIIHIDPLVVITEYVVVSENNKKVEEYEFFNKTHCKLLSEMIDKCNQKSNCNSLSKLFSKKCF